MVNMKVFAYSNFNKKIENKIKSLRSIKNGRFHRLKYRGKLQKVGEGTLKMAFFKPPFSYYPPFWADVITSC